MARWGRASRLLESYLPNGARVLDVGCAFGYGTRLLTRKFHAEGIDRSEEYISRARRSLPGTHFLTGDATALPYPDGSFDGAVMLDVLEHLPVPSAAIDELARVLRPGGWLVLSVPNRGILAGLDSLNLYARLVKGIGPPPTDDPSWEQSPFHRHYSLSDIESMLGARFVVKDRQYTGIGLAEVTNLVLLLVVRRWLRARRLYGWLQFVYFGQYILEDELSLGPAAYHLTVSACRRSE